MTDGDSHNAPDEAVELFSNYVKNEMEASESMEDLVDRHDMDEIESAAAEVYSHLTEEVDDKRRLKTLFVILARVGDTIGSDMMVRRGKEELQKLTEE